MLIRILFIATDFVTRSKSFMTLHLTKINPLNYSAKLSQLTRYVISHSRIIVYAPRTTFHLALNVFFRFEAKKRRFISLPSEVDTDGRCVPQY